VLICHKAFPSPGGDYGLSDIAQQLKGTEGWT